MKIEYEQEQVENFIYRKRLNNQYVETIINPSIEIVSNESIYYLTKLSFELVLEKCIVSGELSQKSYPISSNGSEDLSTQQAHQLINNLFSVVKRLTYEVTEIIFDEPGIELFFSTDE